MGNITNKAQKYLLNNKCADLLLNDNRTTRIEDRIYVSDIMMMFLRSEREQKDSEQQSNCNLPHVSVSLLDEHQLTILKTVADAYLYEDIESGLHIGEKGIKRVLEEWEKMKSNEC